MEEYGPDHSTATVSRSPPPMVATSTWTPARRRAMISFLTKVWESTG